MHVVRIVNLNVLGAGLVIRSRLSIPRFLKNFSILQLYCIGQKVSQHLPVYRIEHPGGLSHQIGFSSGVRFVFAVHGSSKTGYHSISMVENHHSHHH